MKQPSRGANREGKKKNTSTFFSSSYSRLYGQPERTRFGPQHVFFFLLAPLCEDVCSLSLSVCGPGDGDGALQIDPTPIKQTNAVLLCVFFFFWWAMPSIVCLLVYILLYVFSCVSVWLSALLIASCLHSVLRPCPAPLSPFSDRVSAALPPPFVLFTPHLSNASQQRSRFGVVQQWSFPPTALLWAAALLNFNSSFCF
jgi:hypothetical protein